MKTVPQQKVFSFSGTFSAFQGHVEMNSKELSSLLCFHEKIVVMKVLFTHAARSR